jgi:hypothetical protein
MFQYDVLSAAIAAGQTDAAVFAGPARIKGMVVGVPAAGGTLTLKNGSGGTTVFSFVASLIAYSLSLDHFRHNPTQMIQFILAIVMIII